MKVTTYSDAEIFFRRTQIALESHEAANSLMLGICGQLVCHPERIETAPCLKTVEDENGLLLAAIMTPPQKLVVYAHRGDLDGAARMLLRDLVAEGWRAPGVLGPSEAAIKVAERWAEIAGGGYRLERRQRVYELRQVAGPLPEQGRLRPATEADVEMVAQWRHEFHLEIFGEAALEESSQAARLRIEQGDIYLWEDGQPVSMAMKTRPTRRGISVSLVYTPPQFRQRGYATACVAHLSRMLLQAGWQFCALFADLANATSNHIYQRIGYTAMCDYDEYRFLEEE